jgi:hypothetical protein
VSSRFSSPFATSANRCTISIQSANSLRRAADRARRDHALHLSCVVDRGLAIGRQGSTHLLRQLLGQVESLDQAGGAEMAGVDGALQRLTSGPLRLPSPTANA